MEKVRKRSLIEDLKDVNEVQVSQDTVDGVYHAVQTILSDVEKKIILRYYTDNKTYAEISEETGLTVSNISNKKRKALDKLKRSGYVKYGLNGYETMLKRDREYLIDAIRNSHPEKVDIINVVPSVQTYHRLLRGGIKTLADIKHSSGVLTGIGLRGSMCWLYAKMQKSWGIIFIKILRGQFRLSSLILQIIMI